MGLAGEDHPSKSWNTLAKQHKPLPHNAQTFAKTTALPPS